MGFREEASLSMMGFEGRNPLNSTQNPTTSQMTNHLSDMKSSLNLTNPVSDECLSAFKQSGNPLVFPL
eukprot:gene19718-6882_t